MTKYHFSPKTKKAEKCGAEFKCDYSGTEHIENPTKKDLEGFERRGLESSGETLSNFSSLKKGDSAESLGEEFPDDLSEIEKEAIEDGKKIEALVEENKKRFIGGNTDLSEAGMKEKLSTIVDELGGNLSNTERSSIKRVALNGYHGNIKYGNATQEKGAETAIRFAVNVTYQDNKEAEGNPGSDVYDTSKNEYGQHIMIPLAAYEANEKWDMTNKKVKDNEKRALRQANHADDSPEMKVVKKRKSKDTGYRDTTVYSTDGKRFVTIRANEDDPSSSYYIDASGEGEPKVRGLNYGADSAVSNLDDYSREVTPSAGPSRAQKAQAADEELGRVFKEAAKKKVFGSIRSYASAPSIAGAKQSENLSGVTVTGNKTDTGETKQITFYDGSSIHVSSSGDDATYEYLNEIGYVTKSGKIDGLNSEFIVEEIEKKSHRSRAAAEYDASSSEVRNKISSKPEYRFTISTSNPRENDRGETERRVTIQGKTGSIILSQVSTESNIDGKPDIMYDVFSSEHASDGGIYMKGGTREGELERIDYYLDALAQKDQAGDRSGSLDDYM